MPRPYWWFGKNFPKKEKSDIFLTFINNFAILRKEVKIEKMKKIFGGILIVIALILLSVWGVTKAQGVARNPATVIPSGKTVVVPDQATDNSPVLEKAIFIHYRKGYGKPPEAGKVKGSPQCYGFLSKEAKLKTIENFTIHPELDSLVIWNSALEWDSHTATKLFGTYAVDNTANWDNETPDGRNELSFGNYPSQGVIAVTVVWGYFSGSPQTRGIVEFDVMFDTDYVWGDGTVSPTLMDLQNIATHEIGHGVGLGDVYETACSEVTMYGYSDYGETKKITLEQPDITGLLKLYGN